MSMDGYHEIFAHFGANSVFRNVDVPAPELAIDFGERLAPIPIKTNYQSVHKARVLQPDARDIDKATVDGISEPLTEKNFPKTGWLGDYEVPL